MGSTGRLGARLKEKYYVIIIELLYWSRSLVTRGDQSLEKLDHWRNSVIRGTRSLKEVDKNYGAQ